MPALRPFNGITPRLGERVFIDPACTVIGDVHIGDDSSIWPGTVIRGDVNHVRIGARTNIQDGTIIHVSHDGPDGRPVGYPTLIGDDVTIGHGAIVHACRIGNACLIGMGATVLDGAVIEDHGFVGAGAVIPPGKTVRSGAGGTITSTPSICAAICGNSASVSVEPSARTTARNTAFSSWRTLPGHS